MGHGIQFSDHASVNEYNDDDDNDDDSNVDNENKDTSLHGTFRGRFNEDYLAIVWSRVPLDRSCIVDENGKAVIREV